MVHPTAADPADASSEAPLDVATLAEASTAAEASSDTAVDPAVPQPKAEPASKDVTDLPVEIGGQKGPEPTRYGDWETKGRCTDF